MHGLPGLFLGPPGYYGIAFTVLYRRTMYCPALYFAAVSSAEEFIGSKKPYIQIAPVIQRLVFPRARDSYITWLDEIYSLNKIKVSRQL